MEAVSRTDRDIYRLAPTLDGDTLQVIAQRLEYRATDPGYLQMSQAYFQELPLAEARRIVCLGCGTGVEVRALSRLTAGSTEVLGVDHSSELIDVARHLSDAQQPGRRIDYQVGDAHALDLPDQHFDITVLHTLLSHVQEPVLVLKEARRITRPGGVVAVFDGDYASITFDYPDEEAESSIEAALMRSIIANPRVMRAMPRLLLEAGLKLKSATGHLYANIGSGSFWPNVPEAYGPVLQRLGGLPSEVIEKWQQYQAQAAQGEYFFGASNYYVYLAVRDSTGPR